MIKAKTMGEELISAVKEALAHKKTGKIVRPKINVAAVRKKLGMSQKEFAMQYHIN